MRGREWHYSLTPLTPLTQINKSVLNPGESYLFPGKLPAFPVQHLKIVDFLLISNKPELLEHAIVPKGTVAVDVIHVETL